MKHIPVYLRRDNISVYSHVDSRNCESSLICQIVIQTMPPGGGAVLPYQSGGGVPPEPHGAHGERERERERNKEI